MCFQQLVDDHIVHMNNLLNENISPLYLLALYSSLLCIYLPDLKSTDQ